MSEHERRRGREIRDRIARDIKERTGATWDQARDRATRIATDTDKRNPSGR